MAKIVCNYDEKEGYNEAYIYDGFPHLDLRERETQKIVEQLRMRAKIKQWGKEPVRYYVEG